MIPEVKVGICKPDNIENWMFLYMTYFMPYKYKIW